MKYIVVETIDREVVGLFFCEKREEAVDKINELLRKRLAFVKHAEEFDSRKNFMINWASADTVGCKAWCDYQFPWDAQAIEISKNGGECF